MGSVLGEFLSVSHFERPNYDGLLSDFLDRKYASLSVELILTIEDPGATRFSQRNEKYVIATICFISTALFVFGMFWEKAKHVKGPGLPC